MHVALLVDASQLDASSRESSSSRASSPPRSACSVCGAGEGERRMRSVRGRTPRLAPCTGRASHGQAVRVSRKHHAAAAMRRSSVGSRRFCGSTPGAAWRCLLSDFLTGGDLRRAFNLLHSSGLEIFAVQILGPSEIEPELTGDLRFVDCETLGASRHLQRRRSARALPGIPHSRTRRSSARSASSASGKFLSRQRRRTARARGLRYDAAQGLDRMNVPMPDHALTRRSRS